MTEDYLHLDELAERLRRPPASVSLLLCYPAPGCSGEELLRALHALLRELSAGPAPPLYSPPAEVQIYPSRLQQKMLGLLQEHRLHLRRRPAPFRLWLSALTGLTAVVVSVLVNKGVSSEALDFRMVALVAVIAVVLAIALEYLAFHKMGRQAHAPLQRDLAQLLSDPRCLFVLLDSSRRNALELPAAGAEALPEQLGASLRSVRRSAGAPALVLLHCCPDQASAAGELRALQLEHPSGHASIELLALCPCFSVDSTLAEDEEAEAPADADASSCRRVYSHSHFIRAKLLSLSESLRQHHAQQPLSLSILSQHDSRFLEQMHIYLRSSDPGTLDEMGLGADFRQTIEDQIFDILAHRAVSDRDNIYFLANISHPGGYSRGYRLEDEDWVRYQLRLLGQLSAGASRDNLLPICLFGLTLFLEAVWWYGEWHLSESLLESNNAGITIGPQVLQHFETACASAGVALEAADHSTLAGAADFFRQAHVLLRAMLGQGPLITGAQLPLSRADINFDFGWEAVLPVMETLLGRLEDEKSYDQLRRGFWAQSRPGSDSAANLRLRSLLHDKLGDGYEALMVRALRGADQAAAAALSRLALEQYGWTRSLYAYERKQQLESYSNSCPFAYCAWSYYESAELLFRLSVPDGGLRGEDFIAPASRQRQLLELLSFALVELQHYHSCTASFQDFEWELMAYIQLQLAELYLAHDSCRAAHHYCNALLACHLLHFTETRVDGYSMHVQADCTAHLSGFIAGRLAAEDRRALVAIGAFWKGIAIAVDEVQADCGVRLIHLAASPAARGAGLELQLPDPARAGASGPAAAIPRASALLVRRLHALLFEMLALRPLLDLQDTLAARNDNQELENPS